ncbi:hypothetical protein IB236_21145 [Acidovorax sp. ACV02]|uniref:hypothetical protein n=1 Tax=unclassified Acidovorax TaxID=2684926 RepID=UPI0011C3EB68|nr:MULTISPECIES: hypothetical protein [unclassified Acidovorax]MBD9407845.1 hypothetical protein [Acidovorax sp. ACV02]
MPIDEKLAIFHLLNPYRVEPPQIIKAFDSGSQPKSTPESRQSTPLLRDWQNAESGDDQVASAL